MAPLAPGSGRSAVFNAKKLLAKAGFHDFAPGIEGFSEASPRFLADLRRFQTAHDLAPDAVAQPGGPTVHMLTRKVFGMPDGPPPESETEHFAERFAKDPNRTLSGQPIFGGPDAAFIEAGAVDEVVGQKEQIDQPPRVRSITQPVGANTGSVPITAAKNAPRYPQVAQIYEPHLRTNKSNPLHLSSDERAQALATLQIVKQQGTTGLDRPTIVNALRLLWAKDQLTTDDREAMRRMLTSLPPSPSFREFQRAKAMSFSNILWNNLKFRQDEASIFKYTDEQRRLAFQNIVDLYAKLYGTSAYRVESAQLPGDEVGKWNPHSRTIQLDFAKLRRSGLAGPSAFRVVLEEAAHASQHDLAIQYVSGRLSSTDVPFARAKLYALQIYLYLQSGNSSQSRNDYERQPVENDAKAFVGMVYGRLSSLLQEHLRRNIRRNPK